MSYRIGTPRNLLLRGIHMGGAIGIFSKHTDTWERKFPSGIQVQQNQDVKLVNNVEPFPVEKIILNK